MMYNSVIDIYSYQYRQQDGHDDNHDRRDDHLGHDPCTQYISNLMMIMMSTNHIESYSCQLSHQDHHQDHHDDDDDDDNGRSINKASKNDIEGEREQALVDQWVGFLSSSLLTHCFVPAPLRENFQPSNLPKCLETGDRKHPNALNTESA